MLQFKLKKIRLMIPDILTLPETIRYDERDGF